MTRYRWSVAAIVIAATAVLAVAPASGQSPAVSTASGQSPLASPGTSPGVSTGITSVSDGPGFAQSFAYGVASAPDGSSVMVGQHLDTGPTARPGAAAWHSPDGQTWTEASLPQPPRAISLDVAVSALGWVAIGFVPDGASFVWTSTDGLSWVSSTPLQGGVPQTIIATTGGFLIGGQTVTKGVARPTLWHTTDLVTWTRIKLPGKGLVSRLAQLPSGVTLALVATVTASHVTYRYLRSVDGSTWDKEAFPVASSGTDVLSAAELGTSGDRFIQVVDGGPAAGPFAGSIWTSPDGLGWQTAFTATGPLFAVASGPVVNVFGAGTQVSSTDGATWIETARPELLIPSGAAALPDERSLVLDNTNTDPPSVVMQVLDPVSVMGASPPPAASPLP